MGLPAVTLTGKAAVLKGLPDHPAVKALLAWNPDAFTDALFDHGELTLTSGLRHDKGRLRDPSRRRL